MQPTQIKASASANDWLTLGYGYLNGSGKNNGNVTSQAITRKTSAGGSVITWNQSYGYDAGNRLKTVAESGGGSTLAQSFDYDSRGNK